MIIQRSDSCMLGPLSSVCSTVLCIREIIDIIANACLQDKHLGKKTHTLMLSDASIFSEPLSKRYPVSNASLATKSECQCPQECSNIRGCAMGGMITVNCKLDGSKHITLVIAISGLNIPCGGGQRLANLMFLDNHKECESDDKLSLFERFVLGLRNVIISANRSTGKPAIIEVLDAVSRLRFTLHLPRKELRYCTHYTLEEPGMLLELVLPMETSLNKTLRSYLDALALGFFFLLHPRIMFHAPVLGLSEDFLPRYQLEADEEYLRTTLARLYKKDFVIATDDTSKNDYFLAVSICMSPSSERLDHFSIEYLVVVNSIPLAGVRSSLCPTTLENLEFLVEYNISLNRFALADELALEKPFSSLYKAAPQGGALIESCVIVVAIYSNNCVGLLTPDKASLVAHLTLSSDILSSLISAFSECTSKFPSGLKKISDQRQQLQQLSIKHVLADIGVLSSLLLTEEESNAFTRRHHAASLDEAISRAFSSILGG
ncbi:Hypothetical protein GLP15_717 [Giardia lamblia P15]|uniref:Uncharacterized protein n=1 Tax=Giardia intestinalis (strain P15) TaxID=658858 RepID=E1F3Y9_GIAIA|nr:Hypothetical protein GLP15_717 [Giardia lamblia P15]